MLDNDAMNQTNHENLPSSSGSSTTSSSYLKIIQMLEQAIKDKRKTIKFRHNNASILTNSERTLESIQNAHSNNDNDVNLQHTKNEGKLATNKKECCLSNDDFYDGNNGIARYNLNFEISMPSSRIISTSSCLCTNETVGILNTFEAGTESSNDRFNLNETERKDATLKLSQMDKYINQAFC